MKIINIDAIRGEGPRDDALLIADAGLEAIDTGLAIKNSIRIEDGMLCIGKETWALTNAERIFVIGVGKCAVDACVELERILGENLTGGIVLDIKATNENKFKKLTWLTGTHPMPTDVNVDAAKKITELLRGTTERDLVLFVISGGGSTLLCLPRDEKLCVEEEMIVGTLLKAGVNIQEMNTVRKHMSLARGGYLAKHAYPAQVVALIFSDVPGNEIEFVASGPTSKDTTTVDDAVKVLETYRVLEKCGLKDCGLIETPKEDKYFERVRNILLVSNDIALEAMALEATRLGYDAEICDSCLVGEARIVGRDIVNALHEKSDKQAMLYGGETTVTVTGDGKGGRNQELVLAALMNIEKDELVCSIASDGRDNSDVAGAIADTETLKHAQEKGLNPRDFILNNDAYTFFVASGDAIITGVTGSNVSDLVIALKK